MNRVILVFLKFPEPGRVKTRLAADIGDEAATRTYEQLVCRVLEQCRAAAPDQIVITYDPSEKFEQIREWLAPWLDPFPGEVNWLAQEQGDLGDRLARATETVFAGNPDSHLAIIGTDCIHLDSDIFAETWSHLEGETDAVFGPTEDGGYYLLGIKSPHRELFENIPWSSESTLPASLDTAKNASLRTELLPERFDIDTADEWKRVESEVSSRRCLFFDRDGVVNQSPGPGYVLSEDDFHLNPGIADALLWLKKRGWLAILITSQKGVGKGLMTEADLSRIHQKMQSELAKTGAAFDGIYAFTGKPDSPHRPKPDPEMIETGSERFFVEPRQSWIIGDADRDIEMGKAAQLAGTIRIQGDKPIEIEADHTLKSTTEIVDLFEKIL
jgi:rSAM/selenodomain-associated transferase 1